MVDLRRDAVQAVLAHENSFRRQAQSRHANVGVKIRLNSWLDTLEWPSLERFFASLLRMSFSRPFAFADIST